MKITVKILYASLVFLSLLIIAIHLNTKTSADTGSDSTAQNQPQISSPNTITLFDDEFKGKELNSQVWNIYPNGGTITVSNGVLTLKGGATVFAHTNGTHFAHETGPATRKMIIKKGPTHKKQQCSETPASVMCICTLPLPIAQSVLLAGITSPPTSVLKNTRKYQKHKELGSSTPPSSSPPIWKGP